MLTLWGAVLVLSAGPRVSGRSGAGAYRDTGDGLPDCELQLHLLGLNK